MAGKSTVAVCSLAQSGDDFKYFISVLKEQCGVCVKYVNISSTILENGHDFSQYDGVILIHSVSWSRMSLTDVRDARYQKLLIHWKSLLGRDRVAVIVTGVEENTKDLEKLMKEKQPTVIECSAHVLFCGAWDPMNDGHVARKMYSFIRLLPDRPKVRKGHAKPSNVTTQCSEDSTNKETMTIKFKKLKGAGIDVKNSKGKIHVEVIICCEGSTEKTLLKTLSESDLQDEADYLIFKQKADCWELLEAKSISSFDPSSELIHCAVFIYRNGVPPNFSENDYKPFEEIINERTSPTLVEVSGKADVSCLQQLLKVFLDCAYNDHIVTVSPGDVQMASSLPRNQTQREREHQYEATLKKEARRRIQTLHRDLRKMKKDLNCTEDVLTTCKENIRKNRREQNSVQSKLDETNTELQRLTENKAKAVQTLKHKESELTKVKHQLYIIEEKREQVSTGLQEAEKKVNQSEKKIEEVIRELEAFNNALLLTGDKLEEILAELQACRFVPCKANMEVNQTEKKIEELLQELQAFKNQLRNTKGDLSQTKTKTEEVLTEFQAYAKKLKYVKKEHQDRSGCQIL